MIRVEDRLIEIARRKERLAARAQAQRIVIAESFRELRGPIRIVDKGLEAARIMRAHPLLLAAALAAVVYFRGRTLLSLAGRALAAWRLWRSVSAWTAGRLR